MSRVADICWYTIYNKESAVWMSIVFARSCGVQIESVEQIMVTNFMTLPL